MLNASDEHQDIRDAVRELCAQFPDEYFRKVDAEHAYPEAFVEALTFCIRPIGSPRKMVKPAIAPSTRVWAVLM